MKTLPATLAILIAFSAAGILIAAEPPARPEFKPAPTTENQAPEVEPSPMMAEIKAAMEIADKQLADLRLQSKAAEGEKTSLAIMQEVARIKHDSRVEMMRIQLRYARNEGRHEAVAKLETAIARMTAPPAKGVPIPRAGNHQEGRP